MKACIALLALVAMATSASAAKLVVVAVDALSVDLINTGDVVQPFVNGSSPPTVANAKGFVIGIDTTADPVDVGSLGSGPPTNGTINPDGRPLAVQDLIFAGANIVQRRAPTPATHPVVQTKEFAISKENILDSGPGVLTGTRYFAKNDSWWWIDASFPQLVGQDGPDGPTFDNADPPNQLTDGTEPDYQIALGIVNVGFTGGASPPALGTMSLTGSFNQSGNVPHGVWLLAYVVATGDVPISGIIAYGQQGSDMFTGVLGPKVGSEAILRYSDGTIQSAVIPEPSTLVLASMGLVALAVGAWRRRK